MKWFLLIAGALLLGACDRGDSGQNFEFSRIHPQDLVKHPYYSQATTVQGDAKFVYVAGQTDRAPDYAVGSNECRHQDMRDQIVGVRENVEKALHASGADWDDVVFIRRFVTDMRSYRAAMADRDNPLPPIWRHRDPPPSTLIGVTALSEPCQLVEVDVFAVVPADR